MKCHICTSTSNLFSKYQILGKHDIAYYQCSECGFVQTEAPYWLDEAYSDAIADSDIGLVYRNLNLSLLTERVISNHFDSDAKFLDYGGGYGLFVRLMRDKGFDFYWEDKFCQNIFAKDFRLDPSIKHELVTAFELFEHLSDPLAEITTMLQFADSILFSTEILPSHNPRPGEWWYYTPQTGQHISFYSQRSLQKIAERLDLSCYSDGKSNHLLSKVKLSKNLFGLLPPTPPRQSLLGRDAARIFTVNTPNSEGIKDNNQSQILATEKISQGANDRAALIIIDGVFFQLFNTGIGRVWKSLLEEWANTEFGDRLVVLDRANTAPRVAGISYYQIPAYDYNDTDRDSQMLQQVCDEIGAELFISTYYTTPLETPSVFMGYDMIPEVMGWDLNQPMWQEKQRAIDRADAYITISEHTAKDLIEICESVDADAVTVAHCGVQPVFKKRSTVEVNEFCNQYGITKPYFILIGSSLDGYKNAILFWQAFSQLETLGEFEVICTGAAGVNADRIKEFAPNTKIHHLRLEDEELNAAYAGAIALVYPSKYEGFGLPIVEAFASGCPVITCPNASIPEVAGEAAIYVNDDDIARMLAALVEVQKPEVRLALTALGSEQVRQFTWSKMADIMKSVLLDRTLAHLSLSDRNLIIFPDWTQDETELGEEISAICYNLAANPEFDRPTLIIDTSRSEDIEAANMLISGVAMNLMMAADIDITEHLEIALTGELAPIQWQHLLPKLTGKIVFELEDVQAIELAQSGSLPEINAIELSVLVEA